jgi:hypothetical protein
MLYSVVFSKKPTKAEEEKGIGEVVVHGPNTVAAETPEAAVANAAAAATQAGVNLSSSLIQVAVRPF